MLYSLDQYSICCRALVFISHAAGEVCHWYGHIAEQLNKHNIVVFSHDHSKYQAYN